MKNKHINLKLGGILLLSILLVSCATRVPGISDIDKAQPSVTLGTTYNSFDSIDWDTAHEKAVQQCKEFGFPSADSLELAKSSCALYGSFGCSLYQVERKYVCNK